MRKLIICLLTATLLISYAQAQQEIMVNYNKSLKELAKESGFDWQQLKAANKSLHISSEDLNKIVTKNFTIIDFNTTVNTDSVISRMTTESLRPATLFELLTFYIYNKKDGAEFSRDFDFIAMDSIKVKKRYFVAFLGLYYKDNEELEWGAKLSPFKRSWGKSFKFLAVKD